LNENENKGYFEDKALAAIFKPIDEPPAPDGSEDDNKSVHSGGNEEGYATWGSVDPVAYGSAKKLHDNASREPEQQKAEPEPQRQDDAEQQKTPFSAYLNMAVCFFVLLAMSVLAFVLPKPTTSEYERRELAKLPAFSIDAYMTSAYNEGVEAFFSDTFPFRDDFVKFRAVLEDARGIHVDDVTIHGSVPIPAEDDIPDVSDSSETSESKPESSSEETSESAVENSSSVEAPVVPDDGAEGEMVNNVFVYKDMALELFGGSKAMAEYYASVVNDYAAKLGPSVHVYNVVVPTHVEFALPEKYKSLTNSEKKNIDYIYSLLDSGVTHVDAYSQLASHTSEYIYFKTDHHWTGLGAYYAYTAFAKAAGFTAYDYDSYTKHTISPFVGSLYGVTGQDPRLLTANDYVEWCEIPVPHTAYHYLRNDPYTRYNIKSVMADMASGGNAYSVYLYGDYPLTVAETNVGNGRRAVIIKESYGNAFSTYLVPHFEKTFIVDERYFQMNMQEFVKANGITDVIIVNNCFAANTKYHISNISNLLYQTTPTVEQVEQWKEQAAQESQETSSSSETSSESMKQAVTVEG